MVLVAPIAGIVRDLADVPDPVFSGRLMGSGAAIEPDEGPLLTAYAPCSGVIAKLFPGGHAMVIEGPFGPVLLHFGIDTVELHGEGLRPTVAEGDRVIASAPLVEIEVAALRGRGVNLISPVIGIAGQTVKLLAPLGARVAPGEPFLDLLPASA